MKNSVITRWEELREITHGPKRHRESVERWLGTRPALLYWGDSWFSTPLYPNLARQSAEAVDGLLMIAGKPGATAASLLSDAGIKSLVGRLTANPFDQLCLSAGGNDALDDRLEEVFAPWMDGSKPKIAAEAAFEILLRKKIFEGIQRRYQALFKAIRREVLPKRPHFKVIGHSYVPIVLIGEKGALNVDNIGLIALLKKSVGPWLYGPMKHVLGDKAEARKFADLLLVDGFKQRVLEPLKAENGGLFDYADLSKATDLAQPRFWYDEIHPTEDGFARCVPVFNAVIRQALPAAKRGAVGG